MGFFTSSWTRVRASSTSALWGWHKAAHAQDPAIPGRDWALARAEMFWTAFAPLGSSYRFLNII